MTNVSSIFGTDFQGQLVCIAEDREVSGMNVRQPKAGMQSGEKCTEHVKCLSFFFLPEAIPCIIVPELW